MSSHAPAVLKTHDDYAVGWICALPKERAAATAMLDERHLALPKPKGDKNAYTIGSIGEHNIVIACLPKGRYGTNPAATVAAQMANTFRSIKFFLMVGIGGGVPPSVRLGDVVISTPVDHFPGVVQWDMGKAKDGGNFQRTGALNNPPDALLTAMTAMEAEHDMVGSRVPGFLDEMKNKWPRMAEEYLRSDALQDVLFRADYSHVSELVASENIDSAQQGIGSNSEVEEYDDDEEEEEEEELDCRLCDKTKVVKRKSRRKMKLHYGLIASGNQVIKDAAFRDKLNKDLGDKVLCIEMEAAGLMTSVPCAIIRGICDYADSHKNKAWQKHAAAVAAAVAKELLGHVQPSDVDGEPAVRQVLSKVERSLEQVRQQVVEGFSTTSSGLANLQKGSELEFRRLVLNWLSDIDYSLQQNDLITRREPGTAEWLLETPQYQSWLENSSQMLFCPGLPGAGKTIQTAVVVQNLCSRFHSDTTIGIAYFYFNYRRQDDQKIEKLLACLLRQLAACQYTLPASVAGLYERHRMRSTRPSLDELATALQSIVATYSRTFVIIDALDECQDSDRTRTDLLTGMFNLQKACGISIFATSRSLPENMERFKGLPSLEIRPTQNDIWLYVAGHMSPLPDFVKSDVSLQNEIKTVIEEAAEGIFLLARIHLQSLVGTRTPEHLRKELKGIRNISQRPHYQAASLYDAYDKAMKRIQAQEGHLPREAIIILSWVVKAKRQLTVSELQHALAVEAGAEEIDETKIPTAEHMIQACAPLITVEKETHVIQLIHYTAQQFFEQPGAAWLPDAQTEIARTSLAYLSLSEFDDGPSRSVKELWSRMKSYKLFDYAARNWGHHAREASSSLHDKIIDFLQHQTRVNASGQVLNAAKRFSWRWDQSLAGLRFRSLRGLGVPGLLRDGVEAGSSNQTLVTSHFQSQCLPQQTTGLHLASHFGLQTAVEALLLRQNVNATNEDGGTAVLSAAEEGHAAVVKMLIDSGADVNVPRHGPEYTETALSLAAEKGHTAVVKVLIDGGADVNVPRRSDTSTAPALSLAARKGHAAIVKLLLGGGADVDATKESRVNRNVDEETSLTLAIKNRHHGVIKALIDGAATVNLVLRSGGGDVQRTACGLIYEATHRWSAMTLAATMGDETAVRLLLKGGGNAAARSTRIHESYGWVQHTDGRSRSGRNNNMLGSYRSSRGYQPPWGGYDEGSTSCGRKSTGMFRTVCYSGTDSYSERHMSSNRRSRSHVKETALTLAVANGNMKVVKLLLDGGADIKARREQIKTYTDESYHTRTEDQSDTPLTIAVEQGNSDMIELLRGYETERARRRRAKLAE